MLLQPLDLALAPSFQPMRALAAAMSERSPAASAFSWRSLIRSSSGGVLVEPASLSADLIPLDLGRIDPSLGVLGGKGRQVIMKLLEIGASCG